MKITIGGMPGAGKTVVGKYLAEKLGLKFYSMGSIRRSMAEKRGLTINEFNDLKENTDKQVDEFQRELGKKEDDFIFEGRLSFHFIPDSVKIYFDCDLKVAAQRIFKTSRTTEQKGSSVEETCRNLKGRIENDRKRYSKYYKVDCYDKKNFDYVIDTTKLSLEEVEKKARGIIKKSK